MYARHTRAMCPLAMMCKLALVFYRDEVDFSGMTDTLGRKGHGRNVLVCFTQRKSRPPVLVILTELSRLTHGTYSRGSITQRLVDVSPVSGTLKQRSTVVARLQ